jgi:hypothetical protein
MTSTAKNLRMNRRPVTPGLDSRQEQRIYRLWPVFRHALGHTRSPFQWGPAVLSSEARRSGSEADTHLHLVPRLRMGLYLQSPTSLHSVASNKIPRVCGDVYLSQPSDSRAICRRNWEKPEDTLLRTANSLRGRQIQSVGGGKVNILGGHSVGHSKQKCVCVYVHVSYSEQFPR